MAGTGWVDIGGKRWQRNSPWWLCWRICWFLSMPFQDVPCVSENRIEHEEYKRPIGYLIAAHLVGRLLRAIKISGVVGCEPGRAVSDYQSRPDCTR